MKEEDNELQMTVEIGSEQSQPEYASNDIPQDGESLGEDQAGEEASSTLQRMKEKVSEDDTAPIGTLSLKQIVGGDYLFALVRHHIWLIMLIVLLCTVYVGVRYQCEQDVLEIDQLEKDLVNAKYKAMSSSSNLTELCRQSNVLKVLHENADTLLMLSDQPPYIIDVDEE